MLKLLIPLMLLGSGCASAPKGGADAICEGSRKARDLHAQALLAEGEAAVITGQNLISLLDAACAKEG